MDEFKKQIYISRLVNNLPVLRAKLKLTQKELADIIGVSNYSISGMENGQRKMTWNTFMSLLPVFMSNEESAELLRVFGIYTDELEDFLHYRMPVALTDEEMELVAAAGMPVHRQAVSFGGKKPGKSC